MKFLLAAVCLLVHATSTVSGVGALTLTPDNIQSVVANATTKADMKALVASVKGDPAAANLVVSTFGPSRGYRGFYRGGKSTNDAITHARHWGEGRPLLLYKRSGDRWGQAFGKAQWVGPYLIFAGDWHQASKKHELDVGYYFSGRGGVVQFFKDDHGGFAYLWLNQGGSLVFVAGTGMDYGDSRTNPNWLTTDRSFTWTR